MRGSIEGSRLSARTEHVTDMRHAPNVCCRLHATHACSRRATCNATSNAHIAAYTQRMAQRMHNVCTTDVRQTVQQRNTRTSIGRAATRQCASRLLCLFVFFVRMCGCMLHEFRAYAACMSVRVGVCRITMNSKLAYQGMWMCAGMRIDVYVDMCIDMCTEQRAFVNRGRSSARSLGRCAS